MLDRGLRVRRQGRVMRVADDRDDVPREVLEVAASTGPGVASHTYEASLEDLFIAIMERLGHDVKSSEDLLAGVAGMSEEAAEQRSDRAGDEEVASMKPRPSPVHRGSKPRTLRTTWDRPALRSPATGRSSPRPTCRGRGR